MRIPTEPIGSIPRPASLIDAAIRANGDDAALEEAYDAAVRETIAEFEATGSPVVTDGEQWKYQKFWTYSVQGLANTDAGFATPFAAGHTRRMLRLTRGPFRYRRSADLYLKRALRHARVPVKQAVISPSALSLINTGPTYESPQARFRRSSYSRLTGRTSSSATSACLTWTATISFAGFVSCRSTRRSSPLSR